MPYKFEEELRETAESFIKALAGAGFEGAIVPGSFRDYTVKVSVQRAGQPSGHVNLYYSPQKDQFSLKTHELRDKAVIPDLEACWDRLSSPDPAVAAQSNAVTGYQAYTDGSYLDGAIGYGVVVLKDGNPIADLSGPVEEEALQGMRQVGGELLALYKAIEWCQANHVQEVAVLYDYAGIEKWATGEWKANNPATRAYAEFMRDCPISVRWQKVESHSGDRWNDRADQLAKLGAQRDSTQVETGEDPLAELEEKARAFVGLLEGRGIDAGYQGILNGQFARVVVSPQHGCMDLYNTRKRPLSRPYLHGFSDRALQESIENLWQRFLSGDTEDRAPTSDLLSEATYYYGILKPYSDCAFDFIELAAALDRAWRQVNGTGLDVEASRYDFEGLEATYFDLKGGDKTS